LDGVGAVWYGIRGEGFQMIICQNQPDLHILVRKQQNAKPVTSIVKIIKMYIYTTIQI